MPKKKKKGQFGFFYSLSPNAGNVEYNNKVFNDMMLPGGGESSQGEGQAMSETFNSDNAPEAKSKMSSKEAKLQSLHDELPLSDKIIDMLISTAIHNGTVNYEKLKRFGKVVTPRDVRKLYHYAFVVDNLMQVKDATADTAVEIINEYADVAKFVNSVLEKNAMKKNLINEAYNDYREVISYDLADRDLVMDLCKKHHCRTGAQTTGRVEIIGSRDDVKKVTDKYGYYRFTGELEESLNEAKEILYIIKDKNGKQLSAPSKDDSALWDRVEAMEARGREGLSVVVYDAKETPITLTDIADSIKVNGPKVPGAEAPINLLAINEANFADELRFKNYDAVATDDNTIKFTYVAQEPYEHEDAVDFVNEVERAIKALSKSKHYDKPFDVDIDLSVRGEKDFDYKEKLHFNQKAEVMEENLKEEVGMKILKISLDDFDKHIGSRNTFGRINRDYDLIVRTEDGNVFFTGTPDNISKFISDYKVKEIPSARFISYMEKSLKEAVDKSDAHYSDDYKITSMEDMLDSMPGNADDETIDTTLKVFRKVSSYLGTHKKDIVVLVTDPTTEYDPKNSGIKFEVEEMPHRFKKSSLHTYKTPNYEFIREQVYPANMVFLYFKNEGDKDQYLNDVYGAGGVQEENLKESTEAPFTYQLYDEEYIFDEATGNLRVLVDEVMPTTPGVLVNFIFLDHDENKKHPYRFIRKSRGRFPYEFEEVKESLEEAVEEDKPFTYKEIYDELRREGELKSPSGKIHYGFRSEAEAAHKILSKRHKNCDYYLIPDNMIKGAEQWEVVWDDEKLEESLAESTFHGQVDELEVGDIVVLGGSMWKPHYRYKAFEPFAGAHLKVTQIDPVVKFVGLDKKGKDFVDSLREEDYITADEWLDAINTDSEHWVTAFKDDEPKVESLDEKLIQSDSDKALQKNIKTEIKAGKDPKQAAAIAYSVQEKNKKKEESLKTYAGDPITTEEVNQGWEDLEKQIKGLKPGDLITLHNPFDPNGFEHKHVERRTDKPDYYRIYDEGPGGFANEIEYGTLEDALYWAKKTYYSTLIDDDPAESFMDF